MTFCCFPSPFHPQEPERTPGFAPGVASALARHGERPEQGGAQSRVEDQGAETSGRHQDSERKAAGSGEGNHGTHGGSWGLMGNVVSGLLIITAQKLDLNPKN